MPSFAITQPQGSRLSEAIANNASQNNLFLGTERIVDLGYSIQEESDIVARRHFSFGGLCVGRNDELFVVFRAGFAHGTTISSGSKGGNIYYAVSYDYGETWSEPTLFLEADADRDLRDITLTYDAFSDKYILIYSDVSTDYQNGTVILHILVSRDPALEPFVNMDDETPTLPFSHANQTYAKPLRYGNWYYLPIYGQDEVAGQTHLALLRANNGTSVYAFTNWETVKKWDNFVANESCAFLTFDEEAQRTNLNILARGSSDHGYLTSCSDKMVNWTSPKDIGFQCAGGPQVFDIDGVLMLVAREQVNTATYETGFAIFSYDGGQTWTNRCIISSTGPIYATLVRFKNGKTLLSYCQELSSFGRIFFREINGVPTN